MALDNSHRTPSSTGTFLLGIACLAVFAAIVVAWAKSHAPQTDLVEAERADARIKKREELEKEWTGKLETVAWVNKEKGDVQLPIEDAIRVVAKELKAKKVTKTRSESPARNARAGCRSKVHGTSAARASLGSAGRRDDSF